MNKKQQGFTLVELAIVLVIIGLILGMAFKGRSLIDNAKVKNIQAQYNKVLGGFNMYFDRYQVYPGDGCTAANTLPSQCTNASKNGVITTGAEAAAAMNVLIGSGILTKQDVLSPTGLQWNVSVGGTATPTAAAPYSAGVVYMTVNAGAGGAPTASVDPRFACALDKLMDDGVSFTGDVRSNLAYTAATDCWNQSSAVPTGVGSALVTMGVRLLP